MAVNSVTASAAASTVPTSRGSEQQSKISSGVLDGILSNGDSFMKIPRSTVTFSQDGGEKTVAREHFRDGVIRRKLKTIDESFEHSKISVLRVTGMQKWEGRVIEVDSETFEAELSPLDHDGSVVLADFENFLLASQDESGMVSVGDVFYLTVRTVRGAGNLLSRTSTLRLRRLGRWTEEDLSEASFDARRLLAEIESYAE